MEHERVSYCMFNQFKRTLCWEKECMDYSSLSKCFASKCKL